jgi:PAS domain S-box-containing protein
LTRHKKKTGVLRKFGLDFIGDIPWGTHFCQLYENKQDLISIMVPYFAEGLQNNEVCTWTISPPLEVEESKIALRKAVPDLDTYIRKGQIEILSHPENLFGDGELDKNRIFQLAFEREKNALDKGFEGLRVSGNLFWADRRLWKSLSEYEAMVNSAITSHRIIALCAYPLGKCTGTEIVDVLKNHVGALIIKDKEWHLIEDMARRRKTEETLAKTARMFSSLFKNMSSAFAYHKMLYDDNRKPVDYVFLEVNEQFEKNTGLKREKVLGKRVTEVLPDMGKDTTRWIEVYGTVAETGEPVKFESYSEPLGKWFSVSAYSPELGHFAAVFEDITQRKKAEQELFYNATLLKNISDAVISTDVDFNILTWNKAAERTYGFTAEEAIGKKAGLLLETEFPKSSRKKIMQRFLKDGFWRGEVIQKRKDGKRLTILSSTALIKDHEARPVGAVSVNRDVTERREAEELYRNVIQTSIDSFWVINEEGKFLDVNPAYCKLIGYSRAELVKMSIQDVEANESPKKMLQHIKKIKQRGRDRFETRQRRKNGQVVDVEVVVKYMTGDDGRIFAFAHNITRRKRNEEAIKQSEVRYRELADSITDPFFAIDSNLRCTYWNKASETLTGIKAKTAIGKHVFDVFSNDEPTRRAVKVYREVIRTKKPRVFVNEYPIGDSNVFFEIHAYPTKDGISVFSRDITDRKKAEKALMESEEKERVRAEELKTILDAVPAAVWIAKDPESHQIAGNRQSYAILRLSEGANASMSAPEHERPTNYRVLKDQRELKPEEMPVQLAAKGEALRDFEFAIEFTDGAIRHLLGNACPLYDAEGKPRGSVAAFIDITERKAMQNKLEDYSKHLEKLIEEKTKQLKDAERLAAIGETAGMIGHDIRNPLQAIIGELYLSKDCLQSLPENAAKHELADSVRVIEEQTFYIDKIVTDLQDYAKPLAPHIEEVDLENIVDSVLSTVDIPENIEITYSIEKGYPKLLIDSSYMKRILTNLVNNAVQAMPDGGTLTITAYQKDQQAFVSVEDTGEGIPEEARTKIFKPLFTTKAKGQGFGLPVAKKLTVALDGTITFESEKGKGTKFIIQFPHNPPKGKT